MRIGDEGVVWDGGYSLLSSFVVSGLWVLLFHPSFQPTLLGVENSFAL